MKLALSAVALGVSLTATGLAGAQAPGSLSTYPAPPEMPVAETRLGAPKNAFELTVGTGYTQGFGNLRSGVGMPSVATAGLAVNVGLGYRIDPQFGVLVSGEYQELSSERASAARGSTASVAMQYHMRPMQRVDPWVDFGVGYRLLWEDPSIGPVLLTHGFQLARLRVGLDIRTGPNLALGPMIGADVTLFAFQDLPNVETDITDPRVSSFVFAGMQGRFDIGGSTKSLVQRTSQR